MRFAKWRPMRREAHIECFPAQRERSDRVPGTINKASRLFFATFSAKVWTLKTCILESFGTDFHQVDIRQSTEKLLPG
jgi:hypothetical protein